MSNVEFETPAARVIEQFSGKDKESFRINTSLPDLTFLRQLAVQGRLRYNQGNITTADIVITPPTGTTTFLYKAYFFNSHSTNSAIVTVTNNGNTRWEMALPSIATASSVFIPCDFIDSLVGDGIKNFTFSADAGVVRCSVFTWTENTSRIRDVAI